MAGRLRYPGFYANNAALKYQQGMQQGFTKSSSSPFSWLSDLQGSSSSSYGSYGGYGSDPGSCFRKEFKKISEVKME